MSDSLFREVIVQLIGFVIFFWVLKQFAWKPILALLETRRRKIADEFEGIDRKKEELDRLQAEVRDRLSRIEEECRAKIQEAVSDGKKTAQEIREKAREDANQILAKAQENIELEVDKATIEMKEKIADLVILSTERLLKKEMNDAVQRKLVSGILAELEEGSK